MSEIDREGFLKDWDHTVAPELVPEAWGLESSECARQAQAHTRSASSIPVGGVHVSGGSFPLGVQLPPSWIGATTLCQIPLGVNSHSFVSGALGVVPPPPSGAPRHTFFGPLVSGGSGVVTTVPHPSSLPPVPPPPPVRRKKWWQF